MAEDTQLIINIDAETNDFTVKMGDVQKTIEDTTKSGSDGFGNFANSALGLNQALELGAKLMEGVRAALETIDKVEAFDNQKTALYALGSQVGLTKQQVDLLVQTMIKASGDTLTTGQAMTDSYRLLNAGFKAETIPLITEFAKQISLTKPQAGDLSQVMNALANSVEQANTRGLKQIIPGLKETNDRAATLNAILSQAQSTVATTGDQYESFGKRMKTSMSEAAEVTENMFGASLRHVGIAIFGTQAEKAGEQVRVLTQQMEQVDKAANAGQAQVYMNLERADLTQSYTIEQARAIIKEKLLKQQGDLTVATGAEKKAIEDNTEAFKQQGEVKKMLDQATTTKLRLQADKQMYQQMLANKEEFEKDSENIIAGLEKAEKAEIDNRYQENLKSLAGELVSEQEYQKRYLALAKQHTKDLEGIKHEEFNHEQIDNNAAYAMAMKRNQGYAGLAESRLKKDTDAEQKSYDKQVQLAAYEIKDEDQRNKKIEEMATQHQQRLAAIQDKYAKVSAQNFKDGWNNAIAQLTKSNNTFASTVSTMTVGMEKQMSSSFVQMAKAHQFSMSQMLDNMLGFIGESMIQDGTLKLFQGAFPPNPAMLAIGAAEIAAGAALVGATGGAQAPTSTTAGAMGIDTQGQQQLSPQAATTTPQQQATIVINGDLLNSQETVNHIESLIRQNSDTTGFAIVAQGQQY